MRLLILGIAMLAGAGLGCGSVGNACRPGEAECECATDMVCDEGLECDEGVCIEPEVLCTGEPPGGDCPPLCTGGCTAYPGYEEQTICQIDCDLGACVGEDLVCPPGFACTLRCGWDECADVRFQCPETYNCFLRCGHEAACESVTMLCTDGPCSVECSTPGSDLPTIVGAENSCSHSVLCQ